MEYLTPAFLDGLGTVGVSVLVVVSLVTGKGLATQRELRQRDETIAWLRQTNTELMTQNADLLMGTKVATDAFAKVSRAAENLAAGGGEV